MSVRGLYVGFIDRGI